MSARAWLIAVCASELGTLLVFTNFSALLPLLIPLGDHPPRRRGRSS